MAGSRDSGLIRRIEDLERRADDRDAEIEDLERRADGRDAEIEDLVAVKNMGKGVLWLLLKIGAVAMTLIALVWTTIAEN